MGNSADRAWQLSQLMEGVSTAFNPSHCSLSYVQAGHCVSKQVGRHDAAYQGCPRCVSRSPEARLRVFARAVRVSQPAVLSALLAIQLFGSVFPPPNSSRKHRNERCGHSRSQRSFITFYSALRNILLSAGFPAIFHMIALEQTFAALCKKFLLLLFLNRFDSIRNLFIIFALDFPALKNPILEKTNCCIQPSSHSSHASSSSSNQSGLSS